MENVIPFLGAVRNARDQHRKRKQNETVRTALKNISNKSSHVNINNDVSAPKRMRLVGIENKENAENATQRSHKSSKSISRHKHCRTAVHIVENNENTDTSCFSGSSLPSSQSSQDSCDRDLSEYVEHFFENDFALNLVRSNPSEMIFEVPEYVVDIYFGDQERETAECNITYDFFGPPLPPGVYGPELVRQTSISREILAIVVDWMVEVQESMEMNHETFYLAVIMMYRYMSIVPGVSKKTVQLLACTAMWLASKYEERISPAVRDFMYICDDAFTAKDFIGMEQKLFFALDETCHRPISYVFLRRYSRVVDGDDMRMQFLSRYYLELTLQKQSLMLNRESLKAAGALWLARTTLLYSEETRWPAILRFFTRYEESALIDFVVQLHSFAKAVPQSNLQTTFIKYSNKVFLEVALLPQIPDKDFQDLIRRIRVIH